HGADRHPRPVRRVPPRGAVAARHPSRPTAGLEAAGRDEGAVPAGLLRLHHATDAHQPRVGRGAVAADLPARGRFAPAPALTAANRVWKCTVVAIRGLVVKDAEKLALARDGLSDLRSRRDSVFEYVTSGDGFYRDGSFIQHGKHPYTGGYGISLLTNLANLMYLLSRSSWQITDASAQNAFLWIYHSLP